MTMIMTMEPGDGTMREMKAGEFKAKCLAVMDEVAATGEPVVITKHGKRVARLVPEPKDQTGLLEYLRNTVVIVDPDDDLVDTFTPEELEEFDRHLMEEADEFLTPPDRGSEEKE
jgi:prevent-host-death family protein